jgi:hypothetical protein
MKHDPNFQIYNITLSSCAVSLSIVLLFFEFQFTIFSQIYFILVDDSVRFVIIIVNEEERGVWEAVCLLASGIAENNGKNIYFEMLKHTITPLKAVVLQYIDSQCYSMCWIIKKYYPCGKFRFHGYENRFSCLCVSI